MAWNDYANKLPECWRYGIVILLVILCLVLLAQWANSRKQPTNEDILRHVRHILSESSRWQAHSEQDKNSLYALTHANYAVAYCNVARLLMTDEAIRNSIGVNMQEFHMQLHNSQKQCVQTLCHKCPSIQPDNQYSMALGWLQ